jgi:hypothetical protein
VQQEIGNMTLAEIGNRELAWVESAAGNWAYDLRAGDERIASMRFETESGSRARGEIDGRRLLFECPEALHPQISIYEEGCAEPLATFTQRWNGGGLVQFRDGTRYCWNSSHIWSTTYCFRREGEKASVCVSQEVPSRKGSHVTVCSGAAILPETPVLVMLGWFLETLLFERLAQTIVSW